MNIRFYSDPETGLPHIYDHGVTEKERQTMKTKNEFLPGWDEERVQERHCTL